MSGGKGSTEDKGRFDLRNNVTSRRRRFLSKKREIYHFFPERNGFSLFRSRGQGLFRFLLLRSRKCHFLAMAKKHAPCSPLEGASPIFIFRKIFLIERSLIFVTKNRSPIGRTRPESERGVITYSYYSFDAKKYFYQLAVTSY